MPITLLDEMALERNELRSGIIQSLLEQVQIQDRIPWETTSSMHITLVRLSEIPKIPLRLLNEAPDPVQVRHSQSQETLYIMDTDIDIDPVLLKSKNTVMSLEVAQTKGTMAAVGYRVNDLFINGDPGSDVREPMGLKVRLRDDLRFNGNTINATSNTTKLNFSPTATDAELLSALDKLDELHVFVLRGQTSAFISNQQFALRIWGAMRRLRMLATTKDQFDREISVYRGVPILDIGYRPESAINGVPDAATTATHQVIGYDADDYNAGGNPGPGNGANAYQDTTTVYGVRWTPSSGRADGSATDGLIGLQEAPMAVDPIGRTHEPPHYYRTNFLWVFNPCVPLDMRCIGRLVGLQLS